MESGAMHQYEVLKRPILTEKSNYLANALHRYTFEVADHATKQQVQQAVQAIFNVQVVAVNMINVHGKTRRFGRHVGHTSSWRKAIVTLVAGQSVTFFEGV
jgi:large subunit ribosomal protein L23